MRRLLPLLALLLFGCQNDPAVVTSKGTTEEGASRPSQATPATGIQTKAPESEAPKVQNPATEKNDHKSRLYQLRDLAYTEIKVNGKPIPVWVMDTPGKRQEGMMHLRAKDVTAEQGMLFVFPEDQEAGHGFWMSNTYLPLDIIYISPAGKVAHVVAGKPLDETSLESPAAFRTVLEMRGGGAERLGIKPGSTVEIPDSVLKGAS